MRSAAELYPSLATEECFYGPGDYGPIIAAIGEVALQVDDSDYHGDTRVLYRNGNRRGCLIFGWGSCSGCDSLQACGSLADIDALASRLEREVQWFDDPAAALKWFQDRDWETQYSWHAKETRQFVEQAKALLAEEVESQA